LRTKQCTKGQAHKDSPHFLLKETFRTIKSTVSEEQVSPRLAKLTEVSLSCL